MQGFDFSLQVQETVSQSGSCQAVVREGEGPHPSFKKYDVYREGQCPYQSTMFVKTKGGNEEGKVYKDCGQYEE